MKLIFLALSAAILVMSCSKQTIAEKTESSKLYEIYEKSIASKDSIFAEKVKTDIITRFPDSKETFDIASAEFFERLQPVWTNDPLKISVIRDMFNKYPRTGWRRTMYQYLMASLSSSGDKTGIKETSDSFIKEFPDDFLPHITSARYFYVDLKDTVNALDFAKTAYSLAGVYKKAEHFPVKEWELEKRSALVSSGSYLAEILIDKKNYDEALKVLENVLKNHSLGIDDEATLSRPYYLSGKAYLGLGEKNRALSFFADGLIAGDSRDVWKLCDSLYAQAAGVQKGAGVLEHIRKAISFKEPMFNDVTEKYGLKGISASRAAWGDYDNDGYQDLLLDGDRLFKNIRGESFYEISSLAFPIEMAANGAVWGDFNNDGALDFVTKDPEAVWINDRGVFRKVTGEGAITDNRVSTEGIGIADFNGDGYLDIYFANYEHNYNYHKDQLFFGTGGGKFKDVTETSGILPSDSLNRAGRGVNICDFDNDGDQDIFVSNYRLTENFLFINDGKGNFRNAAREKSVAGIETNGWWGHTIGSEWGDIDNDGDFDLITANLAHPRYIDFSNMTMLYENSGAPDYKFSDIRREAGIRFEETHSEPAFGDLNNDGFLDLYINCVYEGRRSFLYLSNGNKTFKDVTYLSGTRHLNGWGTAYADIDNDGDLDMIVAGGKIQLFKNDTPNKGNWLQVKVTGKDHSDAIGTRLKLYNENLSMIREIQGGKGTTNQHSMTQHFGLGKENSGFTLEITFPSGEKHTEKIDKMNRIIQIKE
jgi:tetratricopeptide (TPR) repeat protein